MRKINVFWAIFLFAVILALILALAWFFVPGTSYAISPPKIAYTTISGRSWAYQVPYPIKNKATIEKLIQCESQGVNISRKDSNGLISWGILQFNGTSTWNEAEKRFHFDGSPLIPSDAIHMADMMISAGELQKWTCARMLNL